MTLEKPPTNDRAVEAPKHAASHLLPEELYKPSNFKWPTAAGTGENFVPHLPIYDGAHQLTGKPQAKDGKPASPSQTSPSSESFAAHPRSEGKSEGASEKGDKNAAWTVKKGETLYGKAEQLLRSHGDGHSHHSTEDIRKEVVANAERNNWVKSAESATSPEDKQRRSQFDAYLKDGKTSHLPKDLNGMVHKSMNNASAPAENGAPKPAEKPAAPAEKPATEPVTDLNGRDCKVQPNEGQFASLENKAGKGCTYRDSADPKHPENKELADLVKKGKESTVGIHVRDKSGGGGMGTGVIIGKSEDGSKVYVATDNHVASPEVNKGGKPATERRVLMPDGKVYPAKLEIKDPKTDRAVLSVDVGKGNADKYKAAEFADNPNEKGKGVVLGYPHEAESIYASPANLDGVKPSDEIFGDRGGMLKGEQPNRGQNYMPQTRTEEGVSGGPIFNEQGKAVGLLEGGGKFNPMTNKKEYWSYGNPTSKADVENWLAQIKAKHAGGK